MWDLDPDREYSLWRYINVPHLSTCKSHKNLLKDKKTNNQGSKVRKYKCLEVSLPKFWHKRERWYVIITCYQMSVTKTWHKHVMEVIKVMIILRNENCCAFFLLLVNNIKYFILGGDGLKCLTIITEGLETSNNFNLGSEKPCICKNSEMPQEVPSYLLQRWHHQWAGLKDN